MPLFLNTLAGKPSEIPPIWLMRQAGRYLPEYRAIRAQCPDFLSLCYTPKLATEVTLQPIRRFDFDAAILFSDILVVPDALGVKTWFQEGEGPKLIPLKQGEILTFKNLGKIAPVYQAVSDIRAALPQDKALIGFSGAPWTLMTYIAAGGGGDKQEAALNWMTQHPESFFNNINILSEAIIAHCCAQIDAGAQVIQLFDSWAHVLNGEALQSCSVQPLQQIIQGIHAKYPHIPIILFPRGISESAIAAFANIGAAGLSINETIPIQNVIGQYSLIFQGNLKPEILLQDEQAIITAVQSIIDGAGGKPFIFNLGHGILPTTPIENVHIMLNAVRGQG